MLCGAAVSRVLRAKYREVSLKKLYQMYTKLDHQALVPYSLSLSLSLTHTHTHTHYIYIYIYIYIYTYIHTHIHLYNTLYSSYTE